MKKEFQQTNDVKKITDTDENVFDVSIDNCRSLNVLLMLVYPGDNTDDE